jgi:hypothetical protein
MLPHMNASHSLGRTEGTCGPPPRRPSPAMPPAALRPGHGAARGAERSGVVQLAINILPGPDSLETPARWNALQAYGQLPGPLRNAFSQALLMNALQQMDQMNWYGQTRASFVSAVQSRLPSIQTVANHFADELLRIARTVNPDTTTMLEDDNPRLEQGCVAFSEAVQGLRDNFRGYAQLIFNTPIPTRNYDYEYPRFAAFAAGMENTPDECAQSFASYLGEFAPALKNVAASW